jgi:ParB family transcriptional regulator, chromosome partitioning protein
LEALVKYEAMCSAIEAARAVDEVKDIRDKALAIQMYARQAKNLDAERHAAEIRVRAERRCGGLLSEMPKNKGMNGSEVTPNGREGVKDNSRTLADLGISYKQSSEWQKLAAVPEDQFEEAMAEQEVPSANGVLSHRTQCTGQNEWYTPEEYVRAARDVLGDIELDPASCAAANECVRALRFFTKEDDGLTQEWRAKTLWMNPPYAQPLIGQFIEKLVSEIDVGNVEEAVVLTNDSSDTVWFQSAGRKSQAICLTRGRISFLSSDGEKGSPLQGQAFFYFGSNAEQFAQRFQSIGLVVVPYAH